MRYEGPVRIIFDDREEEDLMKICKQLHEENGMYNISDSKVRYMLHRAFRKEGGILGVIGEPKKIEAMIYMLVVTPWYSEDSHLEELFAFVRPEYRKTKNALELMNFAKWCAEESHLPLLIGVISNIRTKGKIRLYQRQFSDPVGTFFMYKSSKPDGQHVNV